MFTGIITHIGQVAGKEVRGDGATLRIASPMVGDSLARGESVAVAGVCLTVETWDDVAFRVTASPETMRRTRLGHLALGQDVNLERALRAGERMGGHLVQGHVDGLGRVRSVRREGVSRILSLATPAGLRPHLVDRGSVAVDGVSLTVTAVDAAGFEVTLIPETLRQTTLEGLKSGDAVNLEADMVSKYLAHHLRFMSGEQESRQPASWLAAEGE
ncbi:MAG: riboflavin synthase [Acidobacteria bacterium]|nr:riboflavin synthase [Acidobacteriota bacterium]